jgi:hypothetical protein
MAPNKLTLGLGSELRLRRLACDLGKLLTTAEDVWPLAQDARDVTEWADQFVILLQQDRRLGRPCPSYRIGSAPAPTALKERD